jgi:hypothetical protein
MGEDLQGDITAYREPVDRGRWTDELRRRNIAFGPYDQRKSKRTIDPRERARVAS